MCVCTFVIEFSDSIPVCIRAELRHKPPAEKAITSFFFIFWSPALSLIHCVPPAYAACIYVWMTHVWGFLYENILFVSQEIRRREGKRKNTRFCFLLLLVILFLLTKLAVSHDVELFLFLSFSFWPAALPEFGDHGFPADPVFQSGFSRTMASGNFACPLLLVQVRQFFPPTEHFTAWWMACPLILFPFCFISPLPWCTSHIFPPARSSSPSSCLTLFFLLSLFCNDQIPRTRSYQFTVQKTTDTKGSGIQIRNESHLLQRSRAMKCNPFQKKRKSQSGITSWQMKSLSVMRELDSPAISKNFTSNESLLTGC